MDTTIINPKTRRSNKMDIPSRERRARHMAQPFQLKIKKRDYGYHVLQRGTVVFSARHSQKPAIERLEAFLRGCRIGHLVVTFP